MCFYWLALFIDWSLSTNITVVNLTFSDLHLEHAGLKNEMKKNEPFVLSYPTISKRGLYNVVVAPCVSSVMAVPATVIYFTSYDQLCAVLRMRMGEHSQEAPLLAGAIARGELTAVQSDIQLLKVLRASASLVVNRLYATCLDGLDQCNKDT